MTTNNKLESIKVSNSKLSFFIAFIYVALATIYSYWSTYNQSESDLLFAVFFPAIFFPNLILFAESESTLLVFFCQSITILVTWSILLLVINKIRKPKSAKRIDLNA